MREKFDWKLLSFEDFLVAKEVLGKWSVQYREDMPPPDLVIAPDGGAPYLYRWHVVRRSVNANVYFHIQVADDPERPLHDHPWDNMSVILSGGYTEFLAAGPWDDRYHDRKKGDVIFRKAEWGHFLAAGDPWDDCYHDRKKGDVIFRKAEWGHRLMLPKGVPYTMTLFSTGPKRRDWGFWYPEGWKSDTEVTTMIGNRSVHVKPEVK